MGHCLRERHQADRRGAERDHLTPMAFHHGAERGRAEPRSQNPIPVRGRATALKMAEHDRARFRASELANASRNRFADTAESSFEPDTRFFVKLLDASHRRRRRY